jgi:hypothetical protein
MVFQRVLVLVRSLVCLAALFAGEAQPLPGPAAALLQQIHFESKLWPNRHHFLYVLARARNGAPDRFRVAVRAAPLDTEGFGALPAGDRKTWDEAIEAYQANAAPLDISYGKLVDINYAVADLAATARIDEATDIPIEIRDALAEAGPVYQSLWWPRHDANWLPRFNMRGPRYRFV